MKKAIWMVALVLASSSALAEDGRTAHTEKSLPFPMIDKGHIMITGGFGAGSNSMQKTFLFLNPQAEYFVINRVSVGVSSSLMLSSADNASFLAAGPSATYHFWDVGRFATYAGGKFLFDRVMGTESPVSGNSLTFTLGGNYHLLPSFAVGPKVSWTTFFNSQATAAGLGGMSGGIGLFYYI